MESAPLAIALLLLDAAAPGAPTGKDWQSVLPVEKKTLGGQGIERLLHPDPRISTALQERKRCGHGYLVE
jgi:hypothetical protein